MTAQPAISPLPARDAADRFPDFPSRDDMQNSIYLLMPGFLSALYLHMASIDVSVIVCEAPIGWERSQRTGLLIPDLLIAVNADVNAVLNDGGYAINYHGKPPDFVLEVAARDTTSLRDNADRRDDYAAYGIPEYWRFDNTGGDYYETGLAGCRLVNGRYQPIAVTEAAHSRYRGYSAVLGLYVCWEYGHLRWYNPESGYLLTDYQEAAARRAAEAALRVSESRRDAERARRAAAESKRDAVRAERLRLEAEIRRLRGA